MAEQTGGVSACDASKEDRPLKRLNDPAREQRELARLDREARRPKGAYYLLFTMIVLTVIYIVDEITSNVNAAMQPYALFDLFGIASRDVNSDAYRTAINTVAPWQVASNLFLIVTPFYKALSDRFGRRLFLMINTVGMGVGMLIVMTSQSTVQYILGGLALVGLLLFVLSCRLGWGPIAAGVAYGCSIGSLWSMSDTLILTMPAESSPSGMRASVMGTISVMIGAGMFIGQALFIVLQNFVSMDLLFLCICVPFMAVSLLVLMAKVKETKDVDLDAITADTYN